MIPGKEDLRGQLESLGFDEVRFVRVDDVGSEPAERLRTWLAEGCHADMQWLERDVDRRTLPGLVQKGARTVIMFGVNYWQGGSAPDDPAQPRWARYSRYTDYHDSIKEALIKAGKILEELYGVQSTDYRYYVDTGPMLERGWAAQAGVGFLGKNAMLISRSHGNWLFLAALVSTLEFSSDPKATGRVSIGALCGKCERCMRACPTGALREPGFVDSRLCISYHTIENKGIIPRALRSRIGNRVYGCDICSEVCPWNRFAREGKQMLLEAREKIAGLTLAELLGLKQEDFSTIFRKTAIKRVKLAGLLRNACIVAGNSALPEYADSLQGLARHELPMVRAHAVWALRKLGMDSKTLGSMMGKEKDPLVLEEYAAPPSVLA